MFLISGATWGGITVEEGVAISTIGRGKPAYDSSTGLVYAAGRTGVLGLSNGTINLLPATPEMAQGPGYINIGLRRRCTGAATTLAAEGTLLVATDRAFTLADNARYGARNLLLAMSTLNLGDEAALARAAAGALPNGLMLNQRVLDRLLKGNAGPGIPAVETLILNARDSVNVFGSVTLDATQGRARAGWCWARRLWRRRRHRDDPLARTGVDRRVRASLRSFGPVRSRDTGSGHRGPAGRRPAAIGRRAHRVRLRRTPNWLSAQRLALGFAGVDLLAGERVTANGQARSRPITARARTRRARGMPTAAAT